MSSPPEVQAQDAGPLNPGAAPLVTAGSVLLFVSLFRGGAVRGEARPGEGSDTEAEAADAGAPATTSPRIIPIEPPADEEP